MSTPEPVNQGPQPPPLPGAFHCSQCKASLFPTANVCPSCGSRTLQQRVRSPYQRAVLTTGYIGIAFAAAVIVGMWVFDNDTTLAASAAPVANQPVSVSTPAVPAAPVALPKVELAAPATQPSASTPKTASQRPQPQLLKSPMVGATTGGGPYQKVRDSREPLIGFRIVMADWNRKTIVRTLEPIWASDNLAITQSMVVARPGYAVGGVIVDGDNNITAMKVVFMRRLLNGVDPSDSYESQWFGKQTGNPLHLLGGRGDHIIGIYGRKGLNVDALGLLLARYVEPS